MTLASGSNVILLPAQLKATVHMVWLLARPKMAKQDFCEFPRWKNEVFASWTGGFVTASMISLRAMLPLAWFSGASCSKVDGRFSVDLLGHEIRFPDGYRNRCFAIKIHVRQCVDLVSSTDVALDGHGV